MLPLLLQFALVLAAARLGGEICERWLKQPAVLGEIALGAMLGSHALGWVSGGAEGLGLLGLIGGILLLFEIGLECDIESLLRVGGNAIWVAFSGAALLAAGGWAVCRGLGYTQMEAIFVGSALTATSVGITARVFADMKALQTREATIVLGAAVADDVIGLILLAAVSGMAAPQGFTPVALAKLTGLAILFLVGALFLGIQATPMLLRFAGKMQVKGAFPSVAIIFCLLLATLAEQVQLAAIVGAFAAGLILARTEQRIHFETQVKSIADLFVPVFFVLMGAQMDLRSLNPATPAGRATLLLGGLLVLMVIVGKLICGALVPGRGTNRWTVGLGMMPRGEVSLIVAGVGLSSHLINSAIYSAIVFVVLCTTLLTPPLLRRASQYNRES